MCSVDDCGKDSVLEWPLINIAVCKDHYEKPPEKSIYGIKELVETHKKQKRIKDEKTV